MRLLHEDGSFCQGRFVTEDLILQLPDAPVLERHLLFQATDLFALCVVGSPQLCPTTTIFKVTSFAKVQVSGESFTSVPWTGASLMSISLLGDMNDVPMPRCSPVL